ncbi:MAG: hypothetical protein ACE5OZ_22470 [Candidatus Heimdallarchaeota archaeon]
MSKEKLGKRFLTLVKESFLYFSPSNVKQGIKRFTIPSAIVSVLLIAIFLIVALVELPILKDRYIQPDPYRIPYSLGIAVIIMLIWFSMGVWAGPRFGRFLAQNIIGQKAITGSNSVYFEELTEKELKVGPGHILSRFISLLIAWTSISATLVSLVAGFIYDSDPDRLKEFLESSALLDILLKFLLILIIAPIVLTIFVPISWMLLDVHMKAWNKKKRTAWYVGTKVENKTKGYIAAGAIIASAGAIGLDQLDLVVTIFLLNMAWIGLACVLVVLQYSLLFHAGYREIFLETITIPFGLTELTLKDRPAPPAEEPPGEPIPEERPAEPIPEERPAKPPGEPVAEEPFEEPTNEKSNQLFLDEESKTKEESDMAEEDESENL